MPNWCENDLKVTGTKKDVQEFLKAVKSKRGVLDFDTVVPYPEKFRIADEAHEKAKKAWEKNGRVGEYPQTKDGFNSGGYEWRLGHWGTKWNAATPKLDDLNCWIWEGKRMAEAVIHFSTAWSPPLPIVEALIKKFPNLEFDLRYFEQGVGFNGKFSGKNGEVKQNKTGEYFGERGG